MIEKTNIDQSDDYSKLKEFDAALRGVNGKKFVFTFYSDWDSFIFWKPMNWRSFTFAHLYVEFNDYKWIEFDVTLLGCHFCIDWFR